MGREAGRRGSRQGHGENTSGVLWERGDAWGLAPTSWVEIWAVLKNQCTLGSQFSSALYSKDLRTAGFIPSLQ